MEDSRGAKESRSTTPPDAEAEDAPRVPSRKDRRIIAWTLVLILLGGYGAWQLIGLATAKDAVPPSWLITAPVGATIVGEPQITREPYRATTYVTVRPTNGQNAHQLLEEMGLSEQPTQIGPSLLDWRPVWVYSRPTQDGVELRLVYLQDSIDTITP